ncbi:MAG: carboxypeptidase regulatory-like domain-containing protein [Gemmatimonadetes bacterium]|nr:carboxypeptidase regulatory-like domain-containing protein [Gemmatimonadota bacterium]
MSYVLNGRLRARCSADVVEPVANQTVLIYWVPEGEVGDFTVRPHDEARAREYLLLAQGRTDPEGNFGIQIGRDTLFGHRGSTREYAGGPLQIEVYHRGAGGETEPAQFSVGQIQPAWSGTGDQQNAHYEEVISAAHWARVKTALDEWTIVGTVRRTDGAPASGYHVFAYDADPVHDDFLGSIQTSGDGTFRLDYKGSDFRPTPIAGLDIERGGPELYFHVQDADGSVVYEEPSSRGAQSDRARSPNWVHVELKVQGPGITPSIPTPAN